MTAVSDCGTPKPLPKLILLQNGKPPVKVALRGVHKVKYKSPQGGVYVYFYAWRGGPKIEAAPDTPEFIAEFQRLTAERNKPVSYAGTFQDLINGYQRSPMFTDLAPTTRAGYTRQIRKIEAEFGDLPIRALEIQAVRGEFLDWRDGMTSRREADYALTVLARILSWAKDRGRISANHLERPGRLYSGSRAESVWSDAEIDALLRVASPAVALPVLIALHTGQRENDVLRLPWSAYDGQALHLRQTKTGRHVRIPISAEMRPILDAAPRVAITICATSRKATWTNDGFRASFSKAKAAAEIVGRTFHDLRGTAVTRLALAGCTVPEISTITGHDLKNVETILSRHYLSRTNALGESAIAKLDGYKGRP